MTIAWPAAWSRRTSLPAANARCRRRARLRPSRAEGHASRLRSPAPDDVAPYRQRLQSLGWCHDIGRAGTRSGAGRSALQHVRRGPIRRQLSSHADASCCRSSIPSTRMTMSADQIQPGRRRLHRTWRLLRNLRPQRPRSRCASERQRPCRPLVQRLVEDAVRLRIDSRDDSRAFASSMPASPCPAASRPGLLIARDLHGRACGRSACAGRAPAAGRPGSRCTARSRCWPAWAASTPAGAWRPARKRPAARSSSRSARARRARSRAQGAAVRGTRLPRPQPTRGVLVLEVDRPPPPVVLHKVLRDCALRARGADGDPDADHQRGRHDAGGGARARGGAAQGARARLRARRHRRRRGHARRCRRPAPTACRRWAAPTTPSCTAAACTCSVRGSDDAARDAGAAAAVAQLARLRPLVRRHLQGRAATTSTRSTRRCSRRPRCGSATSTAATPGTPARSTWRCCSGLLAAGGLMAADACAIMTDETGWHTRQLQAALRARGARRPLRRPGRLPHRHHVRPGTAW